MMSQGRSLRLPHSKYIVGLALVTAFLWTSSRYMFSQSTVSTGSIQGIVSDPGGAVVNGAKVTVVNKANGQTTKTTTNSAGSYSVAALLPGVYVVRIEAGGFKVSELALTVLVNNTANGNVKMQVGQASETVEVQASSVEVNTEQATVQGVLTSEQIENLPVNGRNFLDLAQLEPGVQIQDGTNFDPTKVGFSSISFGGRFGRTARIEVDGVDVSDETVGTTTEDIPASAIQEFSIAQSNLDLSNELTSSGAVNVVTRSGTNQFHGEAFGFYRDSTVLAAALPTPPGLPNPAYQQNQVGARVGGPILKDKLFFFADGERTLKHLGAPVLYGAPFASYSGFFQAPFNDNELMGRVDYQFNQNVKLFDRFNYFNNSTDATFFSSSFQVYQNKDYTRNNVLGADFNTSGGFSHAIRFSYLKFQNQIVDATRGTDLPFANYPVSINIGSFASGPNFLAPQSTPQSDHQLKYDGSKAIGKHIVRLGGSWNHILAGGYANFYATSANVFSNPGDLGCTVVSATCPAGPDGTVASNPLNYALTQAIISNGQGYSTEIPALGFPAGGLGPDNRLGLYIGDSWKVRPNLTLSPGLRWVRDTGRTDSDLGPIAPLNAAFPGFGNRVRQPNLNFAPQVGAAWDPKNSGKTVVRAGAGLFYENVIFNNVLFDRPLRLQDGAFLYTPTPCLNGVASPVLTPSGTLPFNPAICTETIGQSASAIASLESQLQAAYPFNLNAPNPNYIGNFLSSGLAFPVGLYAPNYITPRSLQMNLGIQHEMRPGMVFSADYIRNVETHSLIGVDVNKVGTVQSFDQAGALDAINATNTSVGCPAGTAGVDCTIGHYVNIDGVAGGAAAAAAYLANGLGTPNDAAGVACNLPISAGGLGHPCGFGGLNQNYNTANFLEPIGRSVYNALQMKLVENVQNPWRGVKSANFQVAYSLSRFVNPLAFQGTTAPGNPSSANDQDFVLTAADNNNPLRFMGPSLLDRTHQLSLGGNFDVPHGFRLGVIGHLYSPLSSPVIIGDTGTPGQIFQTDFTGGGVGSQPLPGTTNGSFMRDFGVTGLNTQISNYNQNVAGQPTPAGQALVTSGLMTASQLASLGLVAPAVCLAPPATNPGNSACPQFAGTGGQLPFTWLKALDFKVAWRHTFQERFTIEPSVGFFNLFNFGNFNLPPSTLSGWLTEGANSINSVQQGSAAAQTYRVGLGTGVFALGSPRATEWGLRFEF